MRGYKIKDTVVILLIIALGLFISMLFSSCEKYEVIYPTPCDGNCGTNFDVIYQGQPIQSTNGYYEIQWAGLNYFQIKGQLSELRDDYVINDVPLVEVTYDSDYWIITDSVTYQTPMYSVLGWFNDATLSTPVTFDNYTYTIGTLFSQHEPLNIVGYQYPKYADSESPYFETLMGSYSKYNYQPVQNIVLDNEMVGDTINVFIETEFNTDVGESEIVTNQIKVIVI